MGVSSKNFNIIFFWMLLQRREGLIQLTPSRSQRNTEKNNFFDFLKVCNELGKVRKFDNSNQRSKITCYLKS